MPTGTVPGGHPRHRRVPGLRSRRLGSAASSQARAPTRSDHATVAHCSRAPDLHSPLRVMRAGLRRQSLPRAPGRAMRKGIARRLVAQARRKARSCGAPAPSSPRDRLGPVAGTCPDRFCSDVAPGPGTLRRLDALVSERSIRGAQIDMFAYDSFPKAETCALARTDASFGLAFQRCQAPVAIPFATSGVVSCVISYSESSWRNA
jgi:hypothetical protein